MKRCIFIITAIVYYTLSIAQTIVNPVFDRTDNPNFQIVKVDATSDTTFVYCSYSATADSWANISDDTYLLSYPSKKRHKILSCSGLPFAPQKREFYYSQTCDVLLCFPPIKGSSHFDLIENPDKKAFNISGVSLSLQSSKKYQELEINRLYNLSSFYESSGDSIKAIQYKKEEIEAVKNNYGIQSDITFFSLLSLCVLYNKYGFSNEATNTISYISKTQQESWGDNSLEHWLQNRTFSENEIITSNYDKIYETIQKSKTMYEKLNVIDYGYALLLRYYADYYNAIGDEQNFIVKQQECIEIRRNLGDEFLYLEDLLLLLIRNATPNVYEERLSVIEKEMKNLPPFVDKQSLDYAYFLSLQVPIYRMTENYQKSIIISNEILTILEKDTNRNASRIVEIQENKINSLIQLSKWHEAIFLGEEIKTMCDSLKIRNNNYKRILSDLANCYKELFDYERAIPLMKELVEIYEKEEDWLSLTSSLYIIGNYFKNKSDLDESEVYLKKAIEIINLHDRAEEYLIKDLVNNPAAVEPNQSLIYYNDMILSLKATSYASLGFVLSSKGCIQEAIECELKAGEFMKDNLAKNAVDKMRKKQGLTLIAYHLLSLSDYYSQNNQYEDSNNCARESIKYFKDGETSDYYRSYIQLAENHCFIDLDSALYYAQEALKASKSYINSDGVKGSLSLLSLILKMKKEYNKAEEYLSEALDYLQNTIKSEIVSMTNEQKQRLWKQNEFDFLLYRDIIARCNRNGGLYSKLLNYTLFSKGLLLDNENMNTKLAYKRMAIIWKDIQKKLSSNDIAIEFVTIQEDSNNKTYYALVIDKNCEYPNMITLFNESAIGNIKHESKNTILKRLGNLIWKPIIDHYKQIDNIYFSPDGIIHLYPIEYCHVDGIGDMMEHFNIFRLSSTKELIFQSIIDSNKNAILYGGLYYDNLLNESNNNLNKQKKSLFRSIKGRGGFDHLSNTLEEVNEIESLLNNKKISTILYTGNNGTEDSFKKLSGKDVCMLHLSTHGMYVEPDKVDQKKKTDNYEFLQLIKNDKDPVKEDIILTHSFLVMSSGNKLTHHEPVETNKDDGILTALEISHVDLSKTDIVVLSACETGLGDVENGGVYGLQRGFKKAGVNTILMSLDKVDDEATKILMVEFYRNLMNGKSKHQSLKEAQHYLRQIDNGKYDDPKYWASFIMLDGIY